MLFLLACFFCCCSIYYRILTFRTNPLSDCCRLSFSSLVSSLSLSFPPTPLPCAFLKTCKTSWKTLLEKIHPPWELINHNQLRALIFFSLFPFAFPFPPPFFFFLPRMHAYRTQCYNKTSKKRHTLFVINRPPPLLYLLLPVYYPYSRRTAPCSSNRKNEQGCTILYCYVGRHRTHFASQFF